MTVQKKLLATLNGAKFASPPVWLMRQAGRYLPEYQELRQQAGDFLSLCYNPEFACRVTLQPIERFGFDAAILFSDILVIPHALGQKLWFAQGEGPQLSPKLIPQSIETLRYDAGVVAPVFAAIKNIAACLPNQTSFIGFAGSPWTLATYMIAGGSSKDHAQARVMAYQYPDHFQALIDVLVAASFDYLSEQIAAGVEVVQLFDSWAGVLPEGQFDAWVSAPTARLVSQLKAKHPQIPIIGFPRGAGYKAARYVEQTRVDALGVDEQADLAWLDRTLPKNFPLQGNLDPALLQAGGQALQLSVQEIITLLKNRPHIFNLGHGIWPTTPITHVEALLASVRGG